MDFLCHLLAVVVPVFVWIHTCTGECQKVVIENAVFQIQTEGSYGLVKNELCQGKAVYKKDLGIKTFYIYFVDTSAFTGWMVGSKVCENMGLVASRDEASSPTRVTAVWEEVDFLLHTWTVSPGIRVRCDTLSPQAIAGIVVGVFGSVLTTISLCWCIYMKCKMNHKPTTNTESHYIHGELDTQFSQTDGTQSTAYSYNNHGYTSNSNQDLRMVSVPPTYEEAMATGGLFYTQNSGHFVPATNTTETNPSNDLENVNEPSPQSYPQGQGNSTQSPNNRCTQAHCITSTGQPQLAPIEQLDTNGLDTSFTTQDNRRAAKPRHDVTILPDNPPPYDSITKDKTNEESKVDNKPNSIEN